MATIRRSYCPPILTSPLGLLRSKKAALRIEKTSEEHTSFEHLPLSEVHWSTKLTHPRGVAEAGHKVSRMISE